jgi:hypothetical protein
MKFDEDAINFPCVITEEKELLEMSPEIRRRIQRSTEDYEAGRWSDINDIIDELGVQFDPEVIRRRCADPPECFSPASEVRDMLRPKYQDKVKAEKRELDRRINLLNMFILYAHSEEQDLLLEQQAAMQKYSQILGKRIERWDGQETP